MLPTAKVKAHNLARLIHAGYLSAESIRDIQRAESPGNQSEAMKVAVRVVISTHNLPVVANSQCRRGIEGALKVN